MSTTAKTGIILVVILAVIVLFWIWQNGKTVQPSTIVDQNSNQAIIPEQTPVSNIANTGLTATTETADASLETDLGAIDTQIKALNDDAANIDQGLKESAI